MELYSWIVYSSFMVIMCIIAALVEKYNYNPIGVAICYLLVVVFWSIRYEIGHDYRGYMEIFFSIRNGSAATYLEPGFRWLNLLFKNSSVGYIGVISCMAALSYFFLFKFFLRENILWLGLFFSLAFQLQYMLSNQIRQALVLVYFFSVFHFLEEKKYLKYIFSMLPMLLFHYSSLFLLLLIPIVKIKLNNIIWATLIISTYILYLLGFFKELGTRLMLYLPLYDQYKTTDRMLAENIGFSVVMLWGILVALYLLFCRKKIDRPVMMTVYLLGIVLYNVFIEFHLIGRVVTYFTCLNVPLAAILCKKDKKWGIPLLVASLLTFLLLAGKYPAYHGNIPYKTIFEFSPTNL